MTTERDRGRFDGHALIMSILLVAFVARVSAQLLQRVAPVEFLPEFDSFQSGAVPYSSLLAAQLVILGLGLLAIRRTGSEQRPPLAMPIRAGLSVFGGFYLVSMLFRLVLGATDRYADSWFDEPVPTVLHLVLASFVLTFAHREWSRPGAGLSRGADRPPAGPTGDLVAVVIYPTLIVGALAAFFFLDRVGAAAPVAAYGTVAVATGLILAAEWVWPARPEWRPTTGHFGNDLTFLVAVQVLMPAAVGVGITLGLDGLAEGLGLRFDRLWPHQWPLVAQVVLMLLIADVLRYWLHRASHQPTFLWRLHAVHHSPDRLYSLNVARFHPLDKLLQYLFDTLPFVVLAVDRRVLLAYFVFYAVNGFFQHCNCHVRLGPLNWIVSGPELHRWHHSRIIRESDQNFGNNLIVWDVIFRTRYLPADDEVDELGLLNRSYPTSFPAQMTSVFVPGLDKKPVVDVVAGAER